MGRSPCCTKDAELNRGAWTAQEDKILSDYIKIHGDGGWRSLPKRAGLKRCGKSCRLRWLNYLRPDIKRGNISADEEELIIRLHRLLGNRWSLIAGRLPGRTDNEIKNYWNTHLGKRLPENQSPPKSDKSQPKSKAMPLDDREFKTTPVKATAVRIAKCCNKYVGNSNSDHQELSSINAPETKRTSESWYELLMDELITEDDSEFNDLPKVESIFGSESPSMETKGGCSFSVMPTSVDSQFLQSQRSAENEINISESLLCFDEISSPDCDLLSSPIYSPRDFRMIEFVARPDNNSGELCSLEQSKSFTVSDGNGAEEIHSDGHQGYLVKELDHLQKSSLQSLSMLLLES